MRESHPTPPSYPLSQDYLARDVDDLWGSTLVGPSRGLTLLAGLLLALVVGFAWTSSKLVVIPLTALLLVVGLGAISRSRWRRKAHEARDRVDRLGKYTLDGVLGQGGMGRVYRARHALLQRPCAIKVLRADARDLTGARERFEREVQLTAGLTHPNTVSIFDYGQTPDGRLYYAMELLEGLDLRQLVKRDGPQPPALVTHILVQAAASLKEAHAAALVHRDIKPANLMLCELGGMEDFVKVLDFGLARPFGEPGQTQAGIMGTPAFMAPEVAEGGTATQASDIYALGAVGYYLLTGRPPFVGANLFEQLFKIVNEPLPPLPAHVPDDLAALITRALARDPSQRPTAAALRSALMAMAVRAPWHRAHPVPEVAAQGAPTRSPHTVDVLAQTMGPEAELDIPHACEETVDWATGAQLTIGYAAPRPKAG